jgi:putative toxin-antitoxin system antitoxin component (TIGR02293 family)
MKPRAHKRFVAKTGIRNPGSKVGDSFGRKAVAQPVAYRRPQGMTLIDKIIAHEVPPQKIIHAIEGGLKVQEMENLRSALDLPMEKFASKLGISKATLHRRKSAGKLDRTESDRVIRFARLLAKAIQVLDSPENARKWLGSPQIGLGGAVPLDYATTEAGAREVEDLLGRIEYGVYS